MKDTRPNQNPSVFANVVSTQKKKMFPQKKYREPWYDDSDSDVSETSPWSAIVLTFLGYATYVFGFLGGFIFGEFTGDLGLNWVGKYAFWFFSFISGTFCLGFGDIIRLLSKINIQLSE